MSDFTIRGVVYPLEVDPATGNLKTAIDEDLISTHILSVLDTEPLESPMRPKYGIPSGLFLTYSDFSVYASEVERRLNAEIKQARIKVTGILNEAGEGLLNIEWEAFFKKSTVTVELSH